jgi:protein MpaA
MFSRVHLTAAALALPLLATPALTSAAPAAPAPAVRTVAAPQADTVVEKRVIGRSRQGRPITAWRVGNPRDKARAVVFSTMHGDERHTRQILMALKDGARVRGIDMWLVPTYNPDGYARHTRKNARGVDLNRNFPYRWRNLDGRYESGARAASEPETRAVMRFLRQVRPKWVVSFHQPLHGVDTDTKRPAFASRLARHLHLPRKRFTCGGVCHGTMTMWFNHHFRGTAITVEYGARPTTYRMRKAAPRQLLSALWARRG